jgi:hypothetical protein
MTESQMGDALERLKVLKMVQEGKISAEEAVKLLETLEKTAGDASQTSSGAEYAGKWFRVRVTDLHTGRNKVNVRLPMAIVRTGVRMGVKFSPQMEGVDSERLIGLLQNGRPGEVLDIVNHEENEHIEVFIE